MARGACAFKITDVAELNRAVKAGGCEVVRVEFGIDGRIVVMTTGENGQGDLDEELTEFKERHPELGLKVIAETKAKGFRVLFLLQKKPHSKRVA